MHSNTGKRLTIADGLVSNTVNALMDDGKGRIWAATDEGISCINFKTWDIHNYHFASQPIGDVYNENAVLRLKDGTLLFGSKDGIIKVYPQLITIGGKASKPEITSIIINGDSTINNLPKSLELKYTQNNITLHFSDFDYASLPSMQYIYKMDDVDKDWSVPSKYNFAIYRNLKPGKYLFRVRCKGSNTNWSDAVSTEVVIYHPWWSSWWAWIIYITASIAIGGYIVITILRMLHLHNELVIEKRISAFKSEFYDKISKEVRNPLSLIQGASENLSTEHTTKTTIQSLRKGSKRMMALMDQVDKFIGKDVSSEVNQKEYREEIATKINEIKNATIAGEVKEMLPPAINNATALIIDDYKDALNLFETSLSPYLKIVSLKSVDNASKIIENNKPAIVILDLSDDKLALETVRSIKRDTATKAIPIIHLSAYSDSEHQLSSARAGTDFFMTKPFSIKVLIANVLNLVSKSQPTDTKDDEPKERQILTKVKDKQFKDKLMFVVDNHLGDETFDVNKLAKLMGYSRAQIYNKVKDLMGVSPIEYIRNRRMDNAAALLKSTSLSVTDIMFKVGIKTTAHFYTTFQKRFGMSPTQYRKQCSLLTSRTSTSVSF